MTGAWPGRIVVAADQQSLMDAAARKFADEVATAIANRGRAAVALAGGSTPRALYELLASDSWRERVVWNKVDVFFGDERYVLPTDPQSNFRMANETLLSRVSIPPENVHRFHTEAGSAESVAQRYEQTLRDYFHGDAPEFDLILLGLGTNGHTASLFPGSAVLGETTRWVVADYVEELGAERLTFTFSLVIQARSILFLVSGAAKAEVLRDVITGGFEPERLPAQLVRPSHGSLAWLLDEPAARLLPTTLRA